MKNWRKLRRYLRMTRLLPFGVVSLAILRIGLFRGYSERLLSTWMEPENRGTFDRAIWNTFFTVWIHFDYYRQKDPELRERRKSLAMGGDGGKAWAAIYGSRSLKSQDDVAGDKSSPVATIDNLLKGPVESQVSCLIQIGSSSGREIAWLARNYPEIECVGTDIYQEVVDFSSESYPLANLEFILASAKKIGNLLDRPGKGKILFFSSGSLQYVQPEHIPLFFGGLSSGREVEVILFETVDANVILDSASWSVPRGNFSYTHNYKKFAEEAGFKTLDFKIARHEGIKTETSSRDPVGHYYWRGTVRG